MRVGTFTAFTCLAAVGFGMTLELGDLDRLPVPRKHKDMSGKRGDPVEKYFHESIFHPHYDGRFAEKPLGYVEQKVELKNLMQTYMATFRDLGIETWLAHGTLLGWWWNKEILPWDSDIDVQISEPNLWYLAAYYNMSVFHYQSPRIPEGRDYMLEINSHYNVREPDRFNAIDARFIDTETGLFIDMTAVRYLDPTNPSGAGAMTCKDGHIYHDTSLFPLRDTYFEGVHARIPYKYRDLLEQEYGAHALVDTKYKNHLFDEEKRAWIPEMLQ